MVFIISSLLIAISFGLGFVLKRKAPNLHFLMCVLISFAIALMVAAAVVGKFEP